MPGSDAGPDLVGGIGEKLFGLGGFLTFVGGVGLLVFAPYMAVRPLLMWSQARLPTAGHGAVLLACFVVLLIWAWMISGKRGDRLSRKFYEHGIKWPFLFSVALLLFAILCFASLSSTLSDLGYVEYEPALPRGEFQRIQDLYSWHFLNAIPALNLPDVLLWNEPFKRKDHLSGWLLLLFKVIVILPVIGSFTVWNKIRKEKKSGDAGGRAGIGGEPKDMSRET